MIANLLLILFAVLFIVVNIVLGCALAVRLGYGPPDWRTALNLVVRITLLQWQLNSWREVIERKAPWADRLLTRLRVPNPIVILEKIDDAELAAELAAALAKESAKEPVTEPVAEPAIPPAVEEPQPPPESG